MRLGGHLPSRDVLTTADSLGVDVVQLHLTSPRVWAHPRPRADAEELRDSNRVAAVHAPYLINPASPDPVVRERSLGLMNATIAQAARCGAGGVVVHAGSAGPKGTIEQAIERWLDVWPLLDTALPILIENTASGTSSPGRHLDSITRLFAALRTVEGPPLGACLDTAHAWAGDPTCAEDPFGWAEAFRTAAGKVAVAHVNDSAVEAGAGRDRHANLAEGTMGLHTLQALIRGAAPQACLLETPGYDDRRRRDLEILRFLVR
ncbi:TIM barrel protein [Euzebya tangerina]|uniref:TIM barrel protein n=1 Tax=Euzebya tangerina TaxID=591198 RepID=UPI000E31C622|nr:TIM barrel protein [Euzebya tangerina]